jgi:hypothetical protein
METLNCFLMDRGQRPSSVVMFDYLHITINFFMVYINFIPFCKTIIPILGKFMQR